MKLVRCVECGAELPREEMFGPSDELRCPRCAQKGRRKYEPNRVVRRDGPTPITVLLLLVAVTVFFFQSSPFFDIEQWIVDRPGSIADGQVWRFFTTVFAHAGVFHLVFNLYWLWIFGAAIEGAIGWWRYGLLVVLLAVSSSCGEFLLFGPAIGLSGVGFGLAGYLFALRRHKDYAAAALSPRTVQLLLIWFVLCVISSSFGGLIANVAHGLGALVGWLTGRAILLGRMRWLGLAALAVAVALMVATAPALARQRLPANPGFWQIRAPRPVTQSTVPRADTKTAVGVS